jgi:hypothetical protein
MVAETKETMSKMFDCWNEGFKAALEANRRTQETWFKTMTDASKNPAGFESFVATGEKVAREVPQFVGKNMETFAQTCDTAFRTNMDLFRAATDFAGNADDGDLYKRSRRMFDMAFDGFRTNLDTFNKAATRSIETCSSFCQAICTPEGGAKSQPRTGKTGQ